MVLLILFNELVIVKSLFERDPARNEDENQHSRNWYIIVLQYDFYKLFHSFYSLLRLLYINMYRLGTAGQVCILR